MSETQGFRSSRIEAKTVPMWAKIYVVNLATASLRLGHMCRLLTDIGLTFEAPSGVEAVAASSHPAFDRIPPMRLRYWAPGEIGCLLSHYNLWLRIADGKEPYGLVLEDDIFMQPIVADLLRERTSIPADADLVKLETVSQPVHLTRRASSKWSDIAFHRLRSTHRGSGAYLISRSAAGGFAARLESFDLPVDEVLWDPDTLEFRHLRRYQAIPALAIQASVVGDRCFPDHLASGIAAERQVVRAAHESSVSSTSSARKIGGTGLHFNTFFTTRRTVPFGPEPISWPRE